MARQRLNPAWTTEMREDLNNVLGYDASLSFVPKILSNNMAAKWLIAAIAERGFIPSVENLGAGVKRIGIKGTCCKLCGAPLGKS